MSAVNTTIDVKQGEYRIIRVDGTELLFEEKPRLKTICSVISCESLDFVVLTKDRSGLAEIVMAVDDTGMIDGKPVNPKATELYRAICKPGTPYSIHGDVVIVNDKDFI